MDIVKHSPTHPKAKKEYLEFSLFENPSKYIDVKYIIKDVLIWIFPWSLILNCCFVNLRNPKYFSFKLFKLYWEIVT